MMPGRPAMAQLSFVATQDQDTESGRSPLTRNMGHTDHRLETPSTSRFEESPVGISALVGQGETFLH